ncbi:siderophore ferric iron reductase [Pollutimonas harenae]|uniref:Siderophore ferric iron reductase n=1 Tax=Pollutimonas harenae TaxID=657015 RepID=A0A853GUD3_9BURK|nr:siderophore ferric iron reductase [Pollutimonas harenae]NYT85881.1 siderophore ferric iron reductase [Pollutimonas harenae]TEA70937.1 siderophore ferric iron reductase [Pollutimonas harenae]
MNHRLEEFTECMQNVMPDWPLDIVSQVDTDWTHTSVRQVGELADSLAQTHPEAGRHYWAFRTWSLLVWQPVYLTLAGIHLNGMGIRPECISQQTSPCTVWGCRIADHVPFEDGEDELLNIAAGSLHDGVARLFNTCIETIDLHPKAAGRLLADYVTSATLRIGDLRADWSADDTVAWGERWLDALGLHDAGGFLRYGRVGDESLAIERKVCCLVYKCHDGTLCDTCPKIPLADRFARLARR